jgi:hypothetical protein
MDDIVNLSPKDFFQPRQEAPSIFIHAKVDVEKGKKKSPWIQAWRRVSSIRVYIIFSSLKYSCSFFFLILFKVTFFITYETFYFFE